jgi:hypothetical protein
MIGTDLRQSGRVHGLEYSRMICKARQGNEVQGNEVQGKALAILIKKY